MLLGARSRGRGLNEKEEHEGTFGGWLKMFEMFYITIGMLVTQLYTFIKTQILHLNC